MCELALINDELDTETDNSVPIPVSRYDISRAPLVRIRAIKKSRNMHIVEEM